MIVWCTSVFIGDDFLCFVRLVLSIFEPLRFDNDDDVEFKLVFVDEHLSVSIEFDINVCVERR